MIDSAGNGVSTLRSIVESGRYFITILDENQIKDVRKFKNIRKPEEYKYGNAKLTECVVEIKDSKEKNYIFECRGVIIDWKKGNKTVAVTTIPKKIINESLVVKSYFDRWPCQELQFKSMKSGASIYRIVGYGKKEIVDEKMQDKRKKLEKSIEAIRFELKEVIDDLEKCKLKRDQLCDNERKLKEQTTIKEGKRVGDADILLALEECNRKIKSIDREINNIKKPHKEEFEKLKKWEKESSRIQGKEHVYVADVELDQLMTCFRMSFANLYSFFLSQCLNNEKMEIQTLIQSFFMLSGTITETETERIIKLTRNEKEPEMMEKLSIGLNVLNSWNINSVSKKKYIFCFNGNR